MSCRDCGNPCATSQKPNCDDGCLDVNQIPGSACTLGFTHQGCTKAFNFTPVVQGCETPTVYRLNKEKCQQEFLNETYQSSNGKNGYIQAIKIADMADCIKLGDLGNVADGANNPDNCAFLVYKKNAGCGDGCQGSDDAWQPWTPNNNKVDKVTNVIGVNDAGCPVVGSLDFAGYFNEKECTYFDPAPGFKISEPGGNSLCYYKNREQMNVVLDMSVTAARPEADYQNVHIATIHDPRFWPKINSGDFIDLPIHGSWDRPGAFSPAWLRFDENGRLLLSGHITARTMSGLTNIMVDGIDDVISWMWKG